MVPSVDTDEVPGMKMRGANLMVRVQGAAILVEHVLLDQKGPKKVPMKSEERDGVPEKSA